MDSETKNDGWMQRAVNGLNSWPGRIVTHLAAGAVGALGYRKFANLRAGRQVAPTCCCETTGTIVEFPQAVGGL